MIKESYLHGSALKLSGSVEGCCLGWRWGNNSGRKLTLPWRKLTLPVWPLSRSRFGPQFAIRLSLIWVRFKCTAVLRKARDKHRISTGSFPPSSFATAASYGDLATFLLTFYRQRYLRSSAATVTRLHQNDQRAANETIALHRVRK